MRLLRRVFLPTPDLRRFIGLMPAGRRWTAVGLVAFVAAAFVAVAPSVWDMPVPEIAAMAVLGLVMVYLGVNHETTVTEVSTAARLTLYGLTSRPPREARGRVRWLDMVLVPRVGSLVVTAVATMMVSASWWWFPAWARVVLGGFLFALYAWIGLFLPLTAAALTIGSRHSSSSAWGGNLGLALVFISSVMSSLLMIAVAYLMWHRTGKPPQYGNHPPTGAFGGLVAGGIFVFIFLVVGLTSTDVLADSVRERIVLIFQTLAFIMWCTFLANAELGGDPRPSFVWNTTIGVLQGAAVVMVLYPGYRAIREDRIAAARGNRSGTSGH